jgi:hypothetical protein
LVGYGKGYRGRFGIDLPPLLDALGLAELTHEARNNQPPVARGSRPPSSCSLGDWRRFNDRDASSAVWHHPLPARMMKGGKY